MTREDETFQGFFRTHGAIHDEKLASAIHFTGKLELLNIFTDINLAIMT